MMKNIDRRKATKWGLWSLLALFTLQMATGSVPSSNYFKAKYVWLAATIQLPPGTDKAKVISFLDAHGADNNGHEDNVGSVGFLPVGAMVRNVSLGFMMSVDMEMKFDFDHDGKLKKFTAARSYTGP